MTRDLTTLADAVIDRSYEIAAGDISPATRRQLAGQARRIDQILGKKGSTTVPSNVNADDLVRRVRAKTPPPPTRQEMRAGAERAREKIANAKAAIAAADNLPRVQVISEGRIYHPGSAHSYVRDLIKVKGRSPDTQDARARLERNNAEYHERAMRMNAAGVNQTASTGGEFVPPMWIVEQAAPVLRAGRPFLNALGTTPLPPNRNQLNVPKITTGSSSAVQVDAGAVSNTDLVTAAVTAQVQTVAGRTIVSYQDSELSAYADMMFLEDLAYATNTALDAAALTGAVTNAKGLLNVTSPNTVTYTDASPTGPEFWAPVTQAAAQLGKVGVSPSFAVTSPSIWWAIAGSLDTTNLRPVFTTVGSGERMLGTDATSDSTPMLPGESDGLFGNIAGIPVCVDANVPVNLGAGTNESRIVVLNRMGLTFWESPLYLSVDDQTSIGTLQNQLIAHVYYAVTSKQSKMITIIAGTGLIPNASYT